MKVLAIVMFSMMALTACGSEEMATDQNTLPSDSIEQLPDFAGWSRWMGAQDQCFGEDPENVLCQTEFVPEKNCGLAIVKFVSISNGYMYVQTKENEIIRQGEFHRYEFSEQPEIFNIKDSAMKKAYSIYKCIGQEG